MHPEQQAPLVLTAMTLRGIFSYMRGSRLEIRPLTMLCGKNGSGKSTWLKALNLLRRSLDAGMLPWGFDVSKQAIDNIEVTNAFYYLGAKGRADVHAQLADAQDDVTFGPPGTIGLEFRASRDIELTTDYCDDEVIEGRPQEFLWMGICRGGMRFRVRIAHPTFTNDDAVTPELRDFIELQIDNGPLIRLQGERDSSQMFEKKTSRPRRLNCTAPFLSIRFSLAVKGG